QKSTREGFGLTVAEGMWKGKPVIGGSAGGITVEIIWGVTGYTVNSVEGCAFRIRYLLHNPDVATQMGRNARESVREQFLITRDLAEHLALMVTLLRQCAVGPSRGGARSELLPFCRHEPRCQSLQKAGHLVDLARHVAGGGAIRGAAHLHRHRRFPQRYERIFSGPVISDVHDRHLP